MAKYFKPHINLVLCLILIAACSNPLINSFSAKETTQSTTDGNLPSDGIGSLPDGGESRRIQLKTEQLLNGVPGDSPVEEDAFVKPTAASPAEYSFEGRLELIDAANNGKFKVLGGEVSGESEVGHLPEFDFEFVQYEDYLVPVNRGLIVTKHPLWNYIIEPGRVWYEPEDGDYSRASFPFALIPKGSNATFNGVMTFLFSDDDVSKVWYQVTQETSISWRIDLWGLLDAEYHPGGVDGSIGIKVAFAQELANRFPSKPIEKLSEDYPGTNVASFGAGVTPENMTYYGYVINGVNYVSGCQTRYGHYAYCDYMRAPSYSTAKSAFVSAAMMRLAQKYDPEIGDFLIKDYVPEAATSTGDWGQVTFDHTLDMATGNYRSAGYMVDEEDFDGQFWDAETYEGKIAAAFNWPHSAEPGTQWVYRTSDTFIVTRALQNYLQSQEGPQADIFRFTVDEVYKPILIGPGFFSTLRTNEESGLGLPYGGYGLWWIQDDIAKMVTFLLDGGRLSSGEQILHPDYVAASLQQNPIDRGVKIDMRSMYNNAFWATEYGEQDGYDCPVWIPQMLGYSGIVILLMPNNTAYYYASDNREFTWVMALKESNNIVPFCD